MAQLSRIFQFITALVLIILAVIRIIDIDGAKQAITYIMNFYYFFFGVVIFLCEIKIIRFLTWFYFMNFGWGKALLMLFLASTMVGNEI